ncbi:MAG: hypothetical protein GX574_16380 [Lentisphaerae bacterium]|nr:hypothetical protein [Lentisphaerota bacterium]OQC16917.1 MAG: hypothetical protein BWX73_00438 [Lentisphaerae bacterium ADurb.Bin082]HQL87287.1 hypothetical protein [Lentisphaeria bacterium]
MSAKKPTMEQWQRAYSLAAEVYALAPWKWMPETAYLGFSDPKGISPHFISILGQLGEHFAIAVYRRVEDLFLIIDDLVGPDAKPEVILETSQLQLSFEDRDYLRPEDRRVIKALKLSFRGRHAWPCFRSLLPGQFPWHVNSEELSMLTLALEHVLAVTPRFKDDKKELGRLVILGLKENVFLMRIQRSQDSNSEWWESMVEFERLAEPEIIPELDEKLLEHTKCLPIAKNKIEVDIRLMPDPVQERSGERPFFPFIMLAVEQASGFIVGHEVMRPKPTLDAVYQRAAGELLGMLAKQEERPGKIYVRTEKMASLLRSLCEKLDIRLTVRTPLRQTERAFALMERTAARN